MAKISVILNIKKPQEYKFPQANNIYYIIKKLDEMTYKRFQSALFKVETELSKRQQDYYKDAMIFLGLIEDGKTTELAKFVMSFPLKNIFIIFVKLILENHIFYMYYKNRNLEFVETEIQNIYKLSKVTAKRRGSTVKSWIKWCDNIIKEQGISFEVNWNYAWK